MKTKRIKKNEKVILDIARFMLETNTSRLMYDSLDEDDCLKKKMKKLDVDFVRLRYSKNDFDPGDSTITFTRMLKDVMKECSEQIIYDFSKYEKDYPELEDEKMTFSKITNRIYYRKNCDIIVDFKF